MVPPIAYVLRSDMSRQRFTRCEPFLTTQPLARMVCCCTVVFVFMSVVLILGGTGSAITGRAWAELGGGKSVCSWIRPHSHRGRGNSWHD